MDKPTCQQCRFSIGCARDDFAGEVLMCITKQIPARRKCGRFEREPGTMEREDNGKDLQSLQNPV